MVPAGVRLRLRARASRGTSSTSPTAVAGGRDTGPGRGDAARPCRAQRGCAVSRGLRDGRGRPGRNTRLRVRGRRAARGAGRRLRRWRRELVAGGIARGPRPVGLAALAGHARPRVRGARDRRPRLGLLGGHSAARRHFASYRCQTSPTEAAGPVPSLTSSGFPDRERGRRVMNARNQAAPRGLPPSTRRGRTRAACRRDSHPCCSSYPTTPGRSDGTRTRHACSPRSRSSLRPRARSRCPRSP